MNDIVINHTKLLEVFNMSQLYCSLLNCLYIKHFMFIFLRATPYIHYTAKYKLNIWYTSTECSDKAAAPGIRSVYTWADWQEVHGMDAQFHPWPAEVGSRQRDILPPPTANLYSPASHSIINIMINIIIDIITRKRLNMEEKTSIISRTV